MKRAALSFLFSCFCMLAVCAGGLCQEIPQKVNIASSPNPVGSGARAVGMGGAFIAVADDATAASWNPGGLNQLRTPEISFAYSFFKRREDFSSGSHPEADGLQEASNDEINYMSAAYPFNFLQRNMVVSLNYQYLYEFDRDINARFINMKGSPPVRFDQRMKFRQRGKLAALSPAYAIEIIPELSIGITCNIWTDKLFWSNGWTGDTEIKGAIGRAGKPATTVKAWDHDRYSGFSGFNMNLGFLWDVNGFLTIGGVLKTPFTGELKHERRVRVFTAPANGDASVYEAKIKEDVDLHMPCSYGLGVALRFTDTFTVSMDLFRTEWSHFKFEPENGPRMNAITGKPSKDSKTYATHQVRLGAEYLFILTKTIIPVRAGVFYDPEPSEKSPEDFYGLSLGTGFTFGNFVFDCAYQYRFGDGVEGDVLDIPSTKADVKQHLFMTSVIYHF